MARKKIFLILIAGFLLFQSIFFVSSQSCISDLKIEFEVYELKELRGETYYQYIKSSYQPNGEDGFVREGDSLFIENVRVDINPSCEKEWESFLIQFKRPNMDEYGEQLQVSLKLDGKNISYYELWLIKEGKDHAFMDFRDSFGNILGGVTKKTLNEEGVWKMRILYPGNNLYENFSLVNKGFLIVDNEIEVIDRIAVTQLETLRQVKNESKGNTYVVLIIGFLTILVGLASIFIMNRTSKKQIKKMDEQYKKQTEKEDEREEGRQLSLLDSLYSELCAIGDKKHRFKLINNHEMTGNLHWFKELLGWEGILPGHGIWYLTTSLYIGGLNKGVKGVNTASLKKMIILINQKIELINNHVVTFGKDKNKDTKEFREAVIKIIDEALKYVWESKKFIENNWKLKKRK